MINIALVALGGALGSVGRYLVGSIALRAMGPGFPWGTIAVNIVGSLVIGMMAEVIALRYGASMHLRLLVVTGFLGGFTTFSAFSLEVAVMIERGDFFNAGFYAAASFAISMAAVFIGLALARQFV